MATTRLRFTVISDVLSGRQFELDGTRPISVGRTRENAIVLDHRSVSRRHARIEPNGAAFVLRDLDSHNGTRIGGEVVTERVLKPGDEIAFGEIVVRFTPIDEAEATPSENLPAVPPTQTAALGRPLSLDEVFPQVAPAEEMEAPPESAVRGALLYSLTLLAVIVLGGLAIWKVSQRPPAEPVIAVQLRAGEVLPVSVDKWRRDATGRYARVGLERVTEVGRPEPENVALARTSKFTTIVIVRGVDPGTTDIPVYGKSGTSRESVILRVLVRGVKPKAEDDRTLSMGEKVSKAMELIARANRVVPHTGVVNERTSDAIDDLERAVALIGRHPTYSREATEAAQLASKLRRDREAFLDRTAAFVQDKARRGQWKEVDAKMQELLRVFKDPESEEYLVVRAYYEQLAEDMARDERLAESRR